MVDEPLSTSRISPVQQNQLSAAQLSRYAISQEASSEELNGVTDSAFNPLAIARRFETLETKSKRRGKEDETAKVEKEEEKIVEVERVEEASEQFQERNPELLSRTLLLLRSRIGRGDSKEEILRKVLETYQDYSLADEALDFLIQTADPELARTMRQSKEDLNVLYGREVRAGRNISAQAREFSKVGLGNPSGLRDMYREVTANPRDPAVLFQELNGKFSYEKMKSVIDFLLHSLGADMKSKGPSISRGELHRLLSETRTLQAILGIYRFFKSRTNMIAQAFQRQGLSLPQRLNFELLAKYFIKLVQERYPSADKALLLALDMGIAAEIEAQLIIYVQLRDAVRQVAPRLYRNDKHRQDVLMMYINALEELDERIEEEEKEKEEKKKKEKKGEKEEKGENGGPL